ncbi:hypothetical protein [Pseudovibrio sp. JE062]|uniref:hypothetical protein n=1 Tax=Pseudovibrio sp. JE062 TaxID=439495 RepID=UPI000A313A77|nr:hypothetical protein [Pseudovibrio sp. JE062]
MKLDLASALLDLEHFSGPNLTQTIKSLENTAKGIRAEETAELLREKMISQQTWEAAGLVKEATGQINVLVHALGILMCLPNILQPGEQVQYLSLGAGNTGRKFDLETDHRIAEFKFINWKGGAESIRQNGVFKDFYLLAHEATEKRRFLYLTGTKYAIKFLTGRRSLASILSRNKKLEAEFQARFGSRYTTVGEYYSAHNEAVEIVDTSKWLPRTS